MNVNSTQSSTYTNAAYSSKGFSGMYSGIDTESLVKSMLSGIQNKIDKQNQSKQILTWKQDLYRDIIKDVNSFQGKFLDLTSKTSLRLDSFFNTAKVSSSSSAVSVTNNSNSAGTEFKMQVARLATATSVSSAKAGSGKIELTNSSNFEYDRKINVKINNSNYSIDLSDTNEISADEVCRRINTAVGNNNFAKVKMKDGEVDGIEFSSNNEFEITGSTAALSILGTGSAIKSSEAKDSDGNVIPGSHKAETNTVNGQFSKIGNIGGTVDVTLDGVKKSIAISETDNMTTLGQKIKDVFGSSVKCESDGAGNWNIYVEGEGRNITISANAETMKAIGFEDGTTVVSSQTLRSDNVGKLVSGLTPNTDYTFTVNGKTISYNSNDSVSSIMNKVNSSGAGVKMTYNDLDGTFKMESTSTGKGFDINVEDNNGLFRALGFEMNGSSLKDETINKGRNAVVNINGSTIERANNNFTYNGVSITLKSTTGDYKTDSNGNFIKSSDGTLEVKDGKVDNAAEIKTSRDTDKIVDTLKSFVEEYNTLIEKLNKLTHEKATYKKYPPLTDAQKKEMSEKEIELWEEKSKEGLLRNDRDISRFLSDMRSALYSSNGSGVVLSNIGIDASSNWQEYGKLSIDEDKLKSALETQASDIQKLFAGDNGLAKKLSKACEDLANTSSGRPGALVSIAGVIGKGTEKSNEIQSKLDSITKKINSLNMLYEKRKARYWKQFNAMETALSNTDSQTSWLSNFMSY